MYTPFCHLSNSVACFWARLGATIDIMKYESGSHYVSELHVHNQAAPVWANDESSSEKIYFEAQ